MTFLDLECDVDLIRSGNKEEFKDVSDNDLINLNRVASLNLLKADLIQRVGIVDSDPTSRLDQIATENKNVLEKALTYKQMELYWFSNLTGGLDSLSVVRFQYYKNEYKNEYERFNVFITPIDTKNVKTILIKYC